VDLENILCQIDSNHHILHLAVLLFVWRLTPRSWHIAMPSGEGGNHPISPSGVVFARHKDGVTVQAEIGSNLSDNTR
jgi:hypothetical protein